MNLHELLQQLKTIEADRAYTRRSRELLLNTSPEAERRTAWVTFLRSLEAGVAFAIAIVLFFVISGGFFSGDLTPLQLSSLDPGSLRAEAEAIDIQIQLTDLSYIVMNAETSQKSNLHTILAPKALVTPEGTLSGPTDEEEPVGIDEALLRLEE